MTFWTVAVASATLADRPPRNRHHTEPLGWPSSAPHELLAVQRVTNGEFEIHFVVPKNIAYTIDAGKLSVYAYDSVNSIEASGHSNDFQIGGSEPEPAIDTNAPTINLFIGDVTFKNGGIDNPNTILMAKL
jgi:hypothetical protein